MLLIERRSFLIGAGAAWASALTPASAARLAGSDLLYAAAYKDADGYGVAILDRDGALVSQNPLPGRGHGFATAGTSQWLVAFARRPGNFAIAFRKDSRSGPVPFHTPADRHFYGHGAFSGDGRLLYAAENDFESGDGIIGIYDATNSFARRGEFASFGVGPHEILMMPDKKTLCIANGGIRTHPDFGREKLNLATMKPSIVFVDSEDGALLSQHHLPPALHRLSLRHMAVDARQQVWIGGQFEGDVSQDVPVLARLGSDTGLVPVDLPDEVGARLGKYVGSVAIGNDGRTLAFTSPKSGVTITLDTRSGKPLEVEPGQGVCGIQACADGFVSSSESGRFAGRNYACAWDNHITLVSGA
ncbi:DUF1513 domain-containing protein [Hoeflea ulvae]|uniref:DUF1513 domain-containing protein n=1 Tax=Hoeflea ulvae TaxID=2983764 RepID=A0ABT3YC79_9HYPH|nr:DUF1513 domain-containing protein [Hoeflea ulvae]MCY0093491.1 DUF1513 domain-containing protein [Hoeflea ulvae]